MSRRLLPDTRRVERMKHVLRGHCRRRILGFLHPKAKLTQSVKFRLTSCKRVNFFGEASSILV